MRDNPKMRQAVAETLWRSGLVGLAVVDGGGALRDCNGAFLDLLDSRYRTRKSLGGALEQVLPSLALGSLREGFERCLRQGAAVHVDAVRFQSASGGGAWVNCMLLPMAAEGGAEGTMPPQVLLLASERKTELPQGETLNLVDAHTRQALARQFHLSAREIDIIGECLRGKKNREIALDLHIGISTVKRHLESAYRKMGISSSRSLPLAILNVLRTLQPAAPELTLSASAAPAAAAAQADSQAA